MRLVPVCDEPLIPTLVQSPARRAEHVGLLLDRHVVDDQQVAVVTHRPRVAVQGEAGAVHGRDRQLVRQHSHVCVLVWEGFVTPGQIHHAAEHGPGEHVPCTASIGRVQIWGVLLPIHGPKIYNTVR